MSIFSPLDDCLDVCNGETTNIMFPATRKGHSKARPAFFSMMFDERPIVLIKDESHYWSTYVLWEGHASASAALQAAQRVCECTLFNGCTLPLPPPMYRDNVSVA